MHTLFSPIISLPLITMSVSREKRNIIIIIIDVFVGNIRYIKIADNELYL